MIHLTIQRAVALVCVAASIYLASPATSSAVDCTYVPKLDDLPSSSPYLPCSMVEIGNLTMLTVDVKLDANLGTDTEGDLIFDLPPAFANPRTQGFILQLYYGGVVGKAQWTPLPADWSANRLFIQPGTVLLPVQWWFSRGLPNHGWLRMVFLY